MKEFGSIAVNLVVTGRKREKMLAIGVSPREMDEVRLVHFTKVLPAATVRKVLEGGISALLEIPGIGLNSENVRKIRTSHTSQLIAPSYIQASFKREQAIAEYREPGKKLLTLQELDAHHCVYAFEIEPSFANKKRFKEVNPNYKEGQPIYYIGATDKTRKERFLEHTDTTHQNYRKGAHLMHKHGLTDFSQANGVKLLRTLKIKVDNLTSSESLSSAQDCAKKLSSMGYGVMVG